MSWGDGRKRGGSLSQPPRPLKATFHLFQLMQHFIFNYWI
jgi:hypothetical protein